MSPEAFQVTDSQQRELYNLYDGIIADNVSGADLTTFLPSHIDPSTLFVPGHDMLVFDVGGSTFKISRVKAACGKDGCILQDVAMEEEKFEYAPGPDGLPLSSVLWNEWVADRIVEFAAMHSLGNATSAAMTFSYPLRQTGIDKAHAISVAKNWCFSKRNLVQSELMGALNASLARRGQQIVVRSLFNDSISSYMAGQALFPGQRIIVLILGTGTNASFLVPVGGKHVLVNPEMAALDVPDSLLTPADSAVIEEIRKTGASYQTLEVMIAGYKFLDVVKAQLMTDMPSDAHRINAVALDDIVEALKTGPECAGDHFSAVLARVAYAYKTRAARILAPLLVAMSGFYPEGEIRLFLTGSVIAQELDRNILMHEVRCFCTRMGIRRQFSSVFYGNASLLGAACHIGAGH